jgi:hypothetical protein
MKTKNLLILTIALTLFTCQEKQKQTYISSVWPEITREMKPWTRWWWMGNAVNKTDIERQLASLAAAGFGGVEITPIYGVKGFEDQYITYLSDEWMEMLDFTIKKADELGMGVDMNLGTGWPFGGPQITPEFAASRLIIQKYELKAGQEWKEKIVVGDPKQNPEDVELLALVAYFSDGIVEDLSDRLAENNAIEWTSDRDAEVVAAFNGKTRQHVKRAAPGGEGLSLDHFSREALDAYLSRFDSAFRKINTRPRSYFNDSFEVYGSSGTKDIFDKFEERKGYDLKNYLRELDSEEDDENVRRIKSDYREVFGDLLLEEFTRPWAIWSNAQNVMTRNQAHGSPGNIIDLYGAVDVPECETFGSSYFPIPSLRRDSADIRDVDPDPIMMKFATSAANVLGKKYASSETFTWLAEHFKVSLSQCKPELEQVFLAGVNHVFYHGTTYSPDEAGWPGWLFYASVQFGPVNSFWPHVNGLNNYIARTQSILQGGNADNDVLVYWPIYDVWNDAVRLDMQISIHNIDEWLHPTSFYKLSEELMADGYLVDFVTDKMIDEMSVKAGRILANPDGGKYKTLIVPACERMEPETLENIFRMAYHGATVIFEELPKDVPGFYDLEKRREKFQEIVNSVELENGSERIGKGKIVVSKQIGESLNGVGIEGESLVGTGLKFVRRDIDGERYYYLVNHTPGAIDEEIALNTSARAVILMDPDHETYGYVLPKTEDGKDRVRIRLESGQSIILRCTDLDVSQIPEWKYVSKPSEAIALDSPWNLSFVSGGPELPDEETLQHLTSWTSLDDEKALNFSGTGVYEYSLDLEDSLTDDYILDLGKVAESARVWVNGQEVDVLWSIPFKIRVGEYLRPGVNTIKIEVANLMANRIRHMDQQGMEWRKFHEINFVNIDYKPFDASGWEPMPSGLLGPVVLEVVGYE